MADTVTVTQPGYWVRRSAELAELLRSAGESASSTIGDPSEKPRFPANALEIADPTYWSGQPAELAEVLRDAAGHYMQVKSAAERAGSGAAKSKEGRREVRSVAKGGARAAKTEQRRLTMTVDEAAQALGISRAFAYDAVTRNQIPHVRIGRRILVPRVALERMLSGGDGGAADPTG